MGVWVCGVCVWYGICVVYVCGVCVYVHVCACVDVHVCVCTKGVVSFEHLGTTREKRDDVLEDSRLDDVVQAIVVGVDPGEDTLQLSFCVPAASSSDSQAVHLVSHALFCALYLHLWCVSSRVTLRGSVHHILLQSKHQT